jgi:toxin ParE1/3/4
LKIRLHPEAASDIDQSAEWYEDRDPGLGEDFLRELDEAFAVIQELPNVWPYWPRVGGEHGVHRYSLKRFPFGVAYLIDDGELVIVAVAHDRRRPGYWLNRVGGT